jgi:fructosamine-3-kinase
VTLDIRRALNELGLSPDAITALPGGDTTRSWRVVSGGTSLFVKTAPQFPHMAETESAGLNWLAAAGAPTPEVLAASADLLVLAWVDTVTASAPAARRFGGRLAAVHQHTAPAFGLAPDGVELTHGWMGRWPMPYAHYETWAEFYWHARVAPTTAAAAANGGLSQHQRRTVEQGCQQLLFGARGVDDGGPASVIHGDLWSGNVLWQSDGAVMIDPAAHCGHPEADLAMLELFGVPHFAEIVAGYTSVRPLAEGWRIRIPLHQVYPLLVHAVLFGGSYGAQAEGAVTAALRSAANST